MAMEVCSVNNGSDSSEKSVLLFWGAQLDGENPTFTFDVPEKWSWDQQLSLRTICLGENAKNEFHVVEIMPTNDSKQSTPVHIATLKPSVLPMATLSGFDLSPPVTFRLKSGSGPVYLAGQHISAGYEDDSEEQEMSSSEEEDELKNSPKQESPVESDRQLSKKRGRPKKKD